MDSQTAFALLKELGGLTHALDMHLSVDGHNVCGEMLIERHHTGAPGIAHGGSIMALLDTVMGACASVHAFEHGKSTSTVELKVNLLRPVQQGQTLVTTTAIESAGRSLVVVSGAALIKETGKRVAFGVGTFNLYEIDMAQSFELLKALVEQERGEE